MNDKPMTVDALIDLLRTCTNCYISEAANVALRAAIEQYGREREAAAFAELARHLDSGATITAAKVPCLLPQPDGTILGNLRIVYPQQEQRGSGEPVAWGQLGTLNGQLFLRSNYDRTPYPPPPSIVRNLNLVPLYTAPQSREPLTDEQINQLWCACLSIENHAFSRDFARAIERAHNIRSEG